jgi:hypothetical protein
VPAQPPVLAETEVASQSAEVGRAWAMRVIGGDSVGRLLEGGKPVRGRSHERMDALDANQLHTRGDVHEHQPPRAETMLADREHGRQPAHRRTDEDRLRVQLLDDGRQVSDEGIHGVVTVGRPVAVAVTPSVDGDGRPPVLDEPGGRRRPGVTGLPASVEEHRRAVHRRRGQPVGDQAHPTAPKGLSHANSLVPRPADGRSSAGHGSVLRLPQPATTTVAVAVTAGSPVCRVTASDT